MKKTGIIFILICVGLALVYYGYNNIENSKEEKTTEEVPKETYYTIYVEGEVNASGKYKFPSTWKLSDVFELLGTKEDADLSVFDLTRNIIDKEHIYVSKIKEQIEDNDSLININKASKSELMSLPGIGEVIASRIIEYRKKTPFSSIDDLRNVSGIGNSVFEGLKDLITV